MKSNTITAPQLAGFMFDVGSLYSYFLQLSDSRQPKGLRYSLSTLLVLMVLARLSGEDHPSGIAEWAQHRCEMLVEALQLSYPKMPHHTTYRRILADVISVEEFEQQVSDFLQSRPKAGRSLLISIDGKTVRGALDPSTGTGVHLLAAYLPDEGIVLAQVAVEAQENEISAAPRLLKRLDLRRKVVIGDAMHTQRKHSLTIHAAGGDFIWLVKDNQQRLRWDVEKLFELEADEPGTAYLPNDFQQATSVNKRHGRLERRTLTVSWMLRDYLDWPHLEQVFKLERHSEHLKDGKQHHQVVYGITSLPPEKASPAQLLSLVRQQWGIENGLHYRRDVTFREDRTRLTQGQAGQAMAILNNLVVGLLAQHGYRNMASARRYFNAQPLVALNLIALL